MNDSSNGMNRPEASGTGAIPAEPALQHRKLGKNILTCAGIFILIFLAVIGFVAYLVSESGLIRVPVLSRFYKGPSPARIVHTEPMTSDAFLELVSSRMTQAVRRTSRPPYRITLTERELSAVMAENVNDLARQEGVRAERVQLVLLTDSMEISGKIMSPLGALDMLVILIPELHDGELAVTVRKAELGDYDLPPGVAQDLVSAVFQRDIKTWKIELGNAELSAVELREGELDLVFTPTSTDSSTD